jgi:hypothetical protein
MEKAPKFPPKVVIALEPIPLVEETVMLAQATLAELSVIITVRVPIRTAAPVQLRRLIGVPFVVAFVAVVENVWGVDQVGAAADPADVRT